MKTRFVLSALVCLWAGAAVADEPVVPAIPAAAPTGSTQLWNGHDLSGWVIYLKNNAQPPADFWKAQDGVLSFAGKVTGYVRTEKDYSNYHLHVEYRWPEKIANSGIFVHVRQPDTLWPYSVQSNVRSDATGDLLPQGGFTFGGSKDTVKKQGDFNEKAVGQWNGCDIFCRDDSIEVFINGEKKNFVEKLSANSGEVALQIEGAAIDFRNVWLESLDQKAAQATP